MSGTERFVPIGRVGKAHGLDGSFYVARASHPLPKGMTVTVAGRPARIERRGGTDDRPLVRLSGVEDRDSAAALTGETLLADVADAPLDADEYLIADLLGCEVPGVGEVTRVVEAPSCDVLEVGPNGTLIPFISDAIQRVDLEARRIDVDRAFLGLDGQEAP
ncbi:MAG TPA: ribosome maturation factor RimM [Thermoleophilaceae bacterium]